MATPPKRPQEGEGPGEEEEEEEGEGEGTTLLGGPWAASRRLIFCKWWGKPWCRMVS